MERGPAERVEVDVGRGLPEGDLARCRSGGDRRRRPPGPRRDPGPDVGHAHAPLAGAGSGQGGPLHELQLLEPAGPHALEVLDGRPHAGADDALGRGRRQRVRLGCGPDNVTGSSSGHPGQDVARGATEIEDQGVALGAVLAGLRPWSPPRGDAGLPFDPSRSPGSGVHGTPSGGGPMATARPRSTPAACSRRAARAVSRPASRLPANRLDLRRASGHHHLRGSQMDHRRPAER